MTDPCRFPRPSRKCALALNPTNRMAAKAKARCVCGSPPPHFYSRQFKFDDQTKTARSSFASSQPRKLASSTPRSVFGWAPSWPPSSMIREVCVCVQRSMLPCVLCLLVPNFGRCARPSYPARTHTPYSRRARGGRRGYCTPYFCSPDLCACVYCVECMTDRLAFNFR